MIRTMQETEISFLSQVVAIIRSMQRTVIESCIDRLIKVWVRYLLGNTNKQYGYKDWSCECTHDAQSHTHTHTHTQNHTQNHTHTVSLTCEYIFNSCIVSMSTYVVYILQYDMGLTLAISFGLTCLKCNHAHINLKPRNQPRYSKFNPSYVRKTASTYVQ